MTNTTFDLGKHRKYTCPVCHSYCYRPARPQDIPYYDKHPYPKPCERCDHDLTNAPFVIEDRMVSARDMLKRN